MFSKLSVLLTAASGLSAVAAPAGLPGMGVLQDLAISISQDEACAKVSAAYSQAARNKELGNLQFPGELAFKCLQSFPFHQEESVKMVDELKKYLQFQSTLEALNRPPEGYMSPAVDLMGGMDLIRQRAVEGDFSNQYEFDDSINTLWNSANDGHLAAMMCTQNVFVFSTSLEPVSVSKDGLELPKIYDYKDAMLLEQSADSVSEIVRINDQDVASYMEQRSALQRYQDPDARYNQMFSLFARTISGSSLNAFSVSQGVWPGKYASQKVEYANGTVADIPFHATLLQEDTSFNYTTGGEAWNAFCAPPSESMSLSVATSVPSKPQPTQYPSPVVRESRNALSGYFLDEAGFEDVAVLFVPTFDPQDGLEFSKTLSQFLHKATRAHKKRLIIDVSANGGGSVNLGLDMFRALFPQGDIYAASRFRSHEAVELMLKALRSVTAHDPVFDYVSSTFALPEIVHVDQTTKFSSWEDVYGPHEELGTNVSSLMANVNLKADSNWQYPIRGYGPVGQNVTTAPFAAENILVVTDGSCTSTCTIFLELLKTMGVKSVTFGGRPQYGPMQAIGGSKGCQAAQMSTFESYMAGILQTVEASADSETPALSVEELHALNATFPRPAYQLPMNIGNVGVNLKNAYHEGDDHMPLQFVYEPADCRLFYTSENVFKPETTWASAAKALWGDGQCVQGSDVSKL